MVPTAKVSVKLTDDCHAQNRHEGCSLFRAKRTPKPTSMLHPTPSDAPACGGGAFFSSSPSSTSRLPMSSTTEDVQLTADGGVKKELLVVGKGNGVETGDILAVEYTAYLEVNK